MLDDFQKILAEEQIKMTQQGNQVKLFLIEKSHNIANDKSSPQSRGKPQLNLLLQQFFLEYLVCQYCEYCYS